MGIVSIQSIAAGIAEDTAPTVDQFVAHVVSKPWMFAVWLVCIAFAGMYVFWLVKGQEHVDPGIFKLTALAIVLIFAALSFYFGQDYYGTITDNPIAFALSAGGAFVMGVFLLPVVLSMVIGAWSARRSSY